MMSEAYVLIKAETGSEGEVFKGLKNIAGVKEAYYSYGTYDLIAKVQAESLDKLREMIFQRIRKIGKIQSTLTLIVTEE